MVPGWGASPTVSAAYTPAPVTGGAGDVDAPVTSIRSYIAPSMFDTMDTPPVFSSDNGKHEDGKPRW